VTILNLTDWLNFTVASIEAEETFIGLGPLAHGKADSLVAALILGAATKRPLAHLKPYF